MSPELNNNREWTPRERLSGVWRTIAKRRGLVIKVTLLVLAAIVLATLLVTPKQKATASLYVRLEQQPVDPLLLDSNRPSGVGAVSPLAVLNSYVETLLSRSTAEQVVRDLKLDQRPPSKALRDRIKRSLVGAITGAFSSITRLMAGGEGNGGGGDDQFRKTVDDVRSSIAAEIDQDTELVLVTVLYPDRRLSQQICQRVVEILMERSVKMSRADALAAYQAVVAVQPAAGERLSQADKALSEFKRREGIVALTDEQRVRVEQLSNLEMQHAGALASLEETQARLAVVRRDLEERSRPITLTTVLAENPTVRQIKIDLYQREQDLAALLQTHTEDHPDVVKLRNEIQSAHERLAHEVERVATSQTQGLPPEYSGLVQSLVSLESDRMGLEAQEQATGAALDEFRARLATLPAKERRLEELAREQRVAAEFYTQLAQRAEQLRMASRSATPPVSIAVIDPPRLPKGVSDIGSPPYLVILILGPILSLLIGLTSAFVSEYFDDTLGTEREVVDRLSLPVLASIPHAAGVGQPLPQAGHSDSEQGHE